MNASSDAARISRASAPIAAPERRERQRAADASATTQSGDAAPVEVDEHRQAAQHQQRRRAHGTAPASPIFSASSAAARRPARARAGRTRSPRAPGPACPAASSTVTNISETATATATANASSDVRAPLTTVCLTWTGLPIDARIGCETSRFSAREPREAGDLLERRRARRVLRQPAPRRLDDRAARSQAEDVDLADRRQVDRAARDDQVQVARGLLEDRRRRAPCWRPRARRRSSPRRSAASAGSRRCSRPRPSGGSPPPRPSVPWRRSIDVRRDHERAQRLAGLDLRDRLLAGLDPDRVDAFEQLVGVCRRRRAAPRRR